MCASSSLGQCRGARSPGRVVTVFSSVLRGYTVCPHGDQVPLRLRTLPACGVVSGQACGAVTLGHVTWSLPARVRWPPAVLYAEASPQTICRVVNRAVCFLFVGFSEFFVSFG